eukprot:10723843-Alexandrium_andersonii.AAC.1
MADCSGSVTDTLVSGADNVGAVVGFGAATGAGPQLDAEADDVRAPLGAEADDAPRPDSPLPRACLVSRARLAMAS